MKTYEKNEILKSCIKAIKLKIKNKKLKAKLIIDAKHILNWILHLAFVGIWHQAILDRIPNLVRFDWF